MSSGAARSAVVGNVFSTSKPTTRRKRGFDVDLVESVRPDGYWPYPYSIEQAFETMRHMVATGSNHDYDSRGQWGRTGVRELLHGRGVVNANVPPVRSLQDLRDMFHRAILARPDSDGQAKWRLDHGIRPEGAVRVPHAVYKPMSGCAAHGYPSEAAVKDALAAVQTGHAGKAMAVSLNGYHPKLKTLHGVDVQVRPTGFVFVLRYGEPCDKHLGSSWDNTIAETRTGESFLDTFARAKGVFDLLVLGVPNGCDLWDFSGLGNPELVSYRHVKSQLDDLLSRRDDVEHDGDLPAMTGP
jgi:hypothetical protein